MRRLLGNFVKILAIATLAPLSFCVALPIGVNELKAMNWARIYGQMPHPQGTERIALHYAIDKISNGDNCDFVIMEARSFPPQQEASIKAFYAEVENPLDPLSISPSPDFVYDTGSRNPFPPETQFLQEVERAHHGPYYLIEEWLTVESAPPMIDWRCP